MQYSVIFKRVSGKVLPLKLIVACYCYTKKGVDKGEYMQNKPL